MHKMLLNSARLTVRLSPDGPLLIKGGEGETQRNPALPDMTFVRTKDQVYLPGSTLKGVIRSRCEYIARSFAKEHGGNEQNKWCHLCCNPLGDNACSENQGLKEKKGHEVYKGSCYICKLFGNTFLAGHISFTDAKPVDSSNIVLEERNGVAIDRVVGSVVHGPFQYEVLVAGDFDVTIDLHNFTAPHLGLVLLALRDLKDQLVRIGFSKSRGLGTVKLDFQCLELANMQSQDRSMFSVSFPDEYGVLPDEVTMQAEAQSGDWGQMIWSFNHESIGDLFTTFAQKWSDFASKGGVC